MNYEKEIQSLKQKTLHTRLALIVTILFFLFLTYTNLKDYSRVISYYHLTQESHQEILQSYERTLEVCQQIILNLEER